MMSFTTAVRASYFLVFLLSCVSLSPGQQPILPGLAADPSAREFDGKYYLYCTHDLPDNHVWKTEDFHAFSSTDLSNWKDEGIIFRQGDVAWTKGFLWAPDCIKRNKKFYLYYSINAEIGVAVADAPTGPFHDPVGKPLIVTSQLKKGRAMDPCVFIDDDGQAYLFIGGSGMFHVARLKSDMVTIDGDIVPLNVQDAGEGPWVHKRDGLYYLSYPTDRYDGPSKNQEMVYSVATNPMGPWTYRGPILLDNGGGNVHGSIACFDSRWFLFYHVEAPTTFQRRVCAERLNYNEDGTIQPVTMTKTGIAPFPVFQPGDQILFQGDSITDGGRQRTGSDYNHIMGQSYAYLLSAKLGAQLPERNLTFVNRGISGNQVRDLAARWQADVLELKPNLLSILVGVNDTLAGKNQESVEEFAQTYDRLLADTNKILPKTKIVLGEPFLLPVGRHKDNFADEMVEMNKHQEVVAKLSEKYHLPLVRYQKAFDDAIDKAPADHWSWDGVHPTYAGHGLMAEQWLKTVDAFWPQG